MTLWQPGMIVTAERLNDFTPVPVSVTATPATDFTLESFSARKSGGTMEWTAELRYTSATTITANSAGNIAEKLCMTLPPECRPASNVYTSYDVSASALGSLRITTAGECWLSSLDPTATIATDNLVRFYASFATG